MKIYSNRVRKIFVYSIVILMLVIVGILNLASISSTESEDVEPNATENAPTPRSSEARNTQIDGYLQLWDTNNNQAHNGIYSRDNSYNKFYLDTTHYNFRIYLKNIDYNDYDFRYVNTTLKPGSGVGSLITIVDPYYNETYMDPGEVDYFDYDFYIGTSAVITQYELVIDIRFVVRDTSFNHIDRSGKIYIKIQLSSRLRTDGGNEILEIEAINKQGNVEPLYSGAKNQLLSMPNVETDFGGTLYDLTFTLDLPSSFVLQSSFGEAEEVRSYPYYIPMWRLTNAGANDAKAEVINSTCDVVYFLSGREITEFQLPTSIEISKTPILGLSDQIPESEIGSTTNDIVNSNVEIYQSALSESFSLQFKNTGNIDLKNVEVELFTDNAAYFFNSNFYYDENDYSNKRIYGKTVSFGDISKGSSITKSFSTEVIKNLPPGLYRIPIKYTATYTQGFIDLDLDIYDYHEDIVSARSTNNEGFRPFILVNVIEGDDENDNTEPDLLAMSSTYLEPGMHNVLVNVQLTNQENYRLTNVNAQITAGYDSPLLPLNEINRTAGKIEAQEKDFTMYAGNYQYTVHFLADIYKNAAPGIWETAITVTCLNPFNQERTTVVKVPLNINPIPPKFIISETTTEKIKPNSNFTLKIKLYNCGGSNAKNVMVMFNGSSNLFSAVENILEIESINKNEEFELEFLIRTGELVTGTTYTASIYISYEDPLGNLFSFDSTTAQIIPLYIEKEEPPSIPRFIISDVSSKDIKPNSNFTLSIKIYNCGDTSGKNVMLMFNSSTNLFSARESIQGPKFMMKNEEAEFDFVIKTGEVEPGKTYKHSILISYEDSSEIIYPFDTNPEYFIELQVKTEEPEVITVVKTEKAEGWEVDQGLALVVLGLLFLISVVIFSILRSKLTKSELRTAEIPREEDRQEMSFMRKPDSNVIDMTETNYPPQQYVPPSEQPAPVPTETYPTSTTTDFQPTPVGQITNPNLALGPAPTPPPTPVPVQSSAPIPTPAPDQDTGDASTISTQEQQHIPGPYHPNQY